MVNFNTKRVTPLRVVLITVLLLISSTAFSRGVYLTNEEFLLASFQDQVPSKKNIWVNSDIRRDISDILGHPYTGIRVAYWRHNNRSVWILEEIGKEQNITFGITVVDNTIEDVEILVYRESRGEEIRQPIFTRQFNNAHLVNDHKLDRYIDGISGATLSVRAMTNTVKLALYLDNLSAQKSF